MTFVNPSSIFAVEDTAGFFIPTYVGMGKKFAAKAHEAMIRAKACSRVSNRRRMKAHLKNHNRWMHRIFPTRKADTLLLTRMDARSRGMVIFSSGGTGRVFVGDGFKWDKDASHGT